VVHAMLDVWKQTANCNKGMIPERSFDEQQQSTNDVHQTNLNMIDQSTESSKSVGSCSKTPPKKVKPKGEMI